jgi:VIT1/CCC1 family predicted Fe2+/Mn2+ transporter
MGAFAPSVGSISASIVGFTVVGLAAAGAIGAKIAGSKVFIPTLRVLIGGCLGMAITAGIGQIFHVATA